MIKLKIYGYKVYNKIRNIDTHNIIVNEDEYSLSDVML